ncbi:MarR family winged helix-turn-helix transcriptional regulator [Novosphingobium guangzhouense]|uniref:HTH marR-type domain-containing protein n=1 Tax=Novosphingobium guangzhouense TaxID=1850347 RepID=A0A2K2G712_9SPHN|nr:MarR family transcriptional regulator [Novosphingobium guangzhouense]PNU06809.1 hypothetical protein A8V01_01115 [Novosphingobium guangzhouense]
MSMHLEILEQMRDLHHRMHRVFNDRVRERGTSLAQLKLLMLLERAGPIRSTDIAEALGQAPRTVTEAVDALERDGLAMRTPDPTDRRAKQISLTPAGGTMAQDAAPYRDAFAAEFFANLPQADMEQFLSILKTLNDRIIEMGAPVRLIPGAASGQ